MWAKPSCAPKGAQCPATKKFSCKSQSACDHARSPGGWTRPYEKLPQSPLESAQQSPGNLGIEIAPKNNISMLESI